MTMTDEEYEAELQARTLEQWDALRDKARADGDDMVALQHLMWRRDVKDWEHIAKLATNPDSTLEDHDYALSQMGELADRLRAARDNPEKRERDRWFNVMSAAAMIGSNKKDCDDIWLEQARDSFPATRGPRPGDDAPLLAQATYAVECLLDALLLKPEQRAELEDKMHAWFMQWAGENGIRHGRFKANGQFEMFGQVAPFPVTEGDNRVSAGSANIQFDLFGKVVPFNSGPSDPYPPPPPGPAPA